MSRKFYYYLFSPRKLLGAIIYKYCWWLPDQFYLRLMYYCNLGHKLDLKSPQTYTAKLQWLKLYDRQYRYVEMVDKHTAKDYVRKIIGNQYIIPTLGFWEHPEEISWDLLPNKFVLKTINGGGGNGVIICKDKASLDISKTCIRLNSALKIDIYKYLKEWPYKYVKKGVIAEQYMEDESGELRDYKFYCFNGEPKVLLIASNRFTSHNFNYFDMDYNKLPITSADGKQSQEEFKRPDEFNEMKLIAKKLSRGIPHVRVDLYCCNHQVYFGELTFFDSSGYDNMSSEKWDLTFGDWLNLPSKKTNYDSKR